MLLKAQKLRLQKIRKLPDEQFKCQSCGHDSDQHTSYTSISNLCWEAGCSCNGSGYKIKANHIKAIKKALRAEAKFGTKATILL